MNETNPQTWRSRVVLASAVVAALTVYVQWPTLHNGFVHWDDPLYLGKVSQLERISFPAIGWLATALLPLYYHPLTWLSHLIDFQLWSWDMAGHHATSVLLHGMNAGLVFLLVWMLTGVAGKLSASARFTVAAVVAATFGIHPLQVEPVAWLAERKTVLCGSFSLMCLCAYLRAVADLQASESVTPRMRWWWLMICLFLAALLSKPMAVSLPVVMLVLDFYPLHRQTRDGWWILLKEKWFLFTCCVALGIVTIVSQSRAGAVTNLAGFGLAARCVVAARNVIFYVWKLIWPAWLSPYYPLEGEIPLGAPEFVFPAIAVICITGFAFSQRRRAPVVWGAWCAYLAMLAPVSGLMQVGGQGAGDRFMYLAMIPILLLLAAGCLWLWRHFGLLGRGALAGLLGCLLLFYGFQARGQIGVWHDDETLWTAAIRYFPDSVLTNWKLSLALMDQHRYEEAQAYAQQAARKNPTYGPMRATLGEIYLKRRHDREALAELQEALRLKPDLYDAQYALACVYSRLNRLDDAYRALQKLLAVKPSYARLAATDEELANLRDDPEFSARMRVLLGGAGTK